MGEGIILRAAVGDHPVFGLGRFCRSLFIGHAVALPCAGLIGMGEQRGRVEHLQRDVILQNDLHASAVGGRVVKRRAKLLLVGDLHDLIGSVLIILVVLAVALHGVLSGQHGDADALDGHALIMVAGVGVHVPLNSQDVGVHGVAALGGQTMLAAHDEGIIAQLHRPLDDVVQLAVALKAGDEHLVLQRQIAVVHDLQRGQAVGAVRFPEDACVLRESAVRLLAEEAQGIAVLRQQRPVAALAAIGGVCIEYVDVQLAGLDLADGDGGAVGEPREGGAHQHGHTHNQRQKAGQQ